MDKVIFIDRDGVINVDLIGDYVKKPDQFRFEKGAVEGLKHLQRLGYGIIIISNQAGVGDGIFTEDDLNATHQHMLEQLSAQGVTILSSYYCLHGKEAGCKCRKPETGLFEQAAAAFEFDRSKTYFIGDKATDIEAGKRFGLKTLFVRTGHGVSDESKLSGDLRPDLIFDNLLKASEYLKDHEN